MSDPQLANIERVAHIFGMHQELDFPVHRDRQFPTYDVVLGIRIDRRIQAKEVLVCFIDLLGVACAEFSVRPGIAKIKCELARLCLDLHCIGRCRTEVDRGPRILVERTERQNLHPDDYERRDHHGPGAAREPCGASIRLRAGKPPHKACKHELGSDEQQASSDHRVE